jgi:hypothetical protein
MRIRLYGSTQRPRVVLVPQYRRDTRVAPLPSIDQLRVHVAVTTVGEASHVSPYVADRGCMLM